MGLIIGDLVERKPLVDGIARHHGFDRDETNVLRLLDQVSTSIDSAELAWYVLEDRVTEEMRQAFVMLAPARAKWFYQGDQDTYREALKQAFMGFVELDEAAQQHSCTHRYGLAQHYVQAWQEAYADRLGSDAAMADIAPVLEVFPEMINDLGPTLDISSVQQAGRIVQRSLLDTYLRGTGPFEINRVADIVSDKELFTLARFGPANLEILDLLETRLGSEAMVEAYLSALFTQSSGLRDCIPSWVKENPATFSQLFMQRLEETREQGRWFAYDPNTQQRLFALIRDHANPGQQVALALGTLMMKKRGNWAPELKGHPMNGTVKNLRKNPPAPGEWGPILAQIARYLDNGKTPEQNYQKLDMNAVILPLCRSNCQNRADAAKLLQGSILRLLTTKKHLDDLDYPVDAHSQVMDHMPNILQHVRARYMIYGYPDALKTTLNKQLDGIEAKLDQQRERLLQRQSPRPSGLAKRPGTRDDAHQLSVL